MLISNVTPIGMKSILEHTKQVYWTKSVLAEHV